MGVGAFLVAALGSQQILVQVQVLVLVPVCRPVLLSFLLGGGEQVLMCSGGAVMEQ